MLSIIIAKLIYQLKQVLGFTIIAKSSALPVWTLIHDIVQNNIAGLPVIHEVATKLIFIT